jgi:mono/diheme cytochrome c family protein
VARDRTANGDARQRIVRWACGWIVLGTLLLAPSAAWYYASIPGFSKIYLSGMLVSTQHIARAGIGSAALALLLASICGLWKPRLMRLPIIVVLLAAGLGIIGSLEYLREFVRKPWAIQGYIYANDIPAAAVAHYREVGTLKAAKFLAGGDSDSPADAASASDGVVDGRQLFQLQCGRCHSVGGYRAIRSRVRGWNAQFATDMLAHIEKARGTMPPFAGDERDRAALGSYLASLNPAPSFAGQEAMQVGRQVYETRCGVCHTVNGPFRPLSNVLAGAAPDQIEALLPVLESMSPEMPPFSAPPEQGQALAAYLARALAAAPAREGR